MGSITLIVQSSGTLYGYENLKRVRVCGIMDEAEAVYCYSPSCLGVCDWTGCSGVNSELLSLEDSLQPLSSACSLKQPLLPQLFDLASNEK